MNEKFQYASESVKRLNPHIFGDSLAGRVRSSKPKQDNGGEGEAGGLVEGKASMGYRVHLITFRRRLLDEHDNLPGSCKPLVDSITKHLGFASDDDKRLHWDYSQVQTKGRQGVLVKIDEI